MRKYQKQKVDVALWIVVIALAVLVISIIIKSLLSFYKYLLS